MWTAQNSKACKKTQGCQSNCHPNADSEGDSKNKARG